MASQSLSSIHISCLARPVRFDVSPDERFLIPFQTAFNHFPSSRTIWPEPLDIPVLAKVALPNSAVNRWPRRGCETSLS